MKSKVSFFVLLALLFGYLPVKAQNKIGYINDAKLFNAMPETEQALKELNDFRESYSKKLYDEQDANVAAINKWYIDSAKHTRAENQQKIDEYNKQYNFIYSQQLNAEAVINEKSEKLFSPIREKLVKVVQDYAKANGYAHIILQSNAVVLNKTDDITEEILKKITTK